MPYLLQFQLRVSQYTVLQCYSVTMCPLCANCSTWPLHQICDYTRVACKDFHWEKTLQKWISMRLLKFNACLIEIIIDLFSDLFDHPGTIFYAVFMSFWGRCLLNADKGWLQNIKLTKYGFGCNLGQMLWYFYNLASLYLLPHPLKHTWSATESPNPCMASIWFISTVLLWS